MILFGDFLLKKHNLKSCFSYNQTFSHSDALFNSRVALVKSQVMDGEKKKCKFDKYRDYFYKLVDKRISELQWLAEKSNSFDCLFVSKSKKQAKSQNSKHPENRSEYIGVSRNGRGWQSLVIIKKVKLYISTSHTEIQASRVCDFYTMLHHFQDGKYNQHYTIRQALEVSPFQYFLGLLLL